MLENANDILPISESEELRKFKIAGRQQPRYGTQRIWTSKIAPSFGNLASEIQIIDDVTKVAIAGATKAVLQIRVEERDWNGVVNAFNNTCLLKSGEEDGRYDSYTKSGRDWFKIDLGTNRAVIQEVKAWFEKLISDSDILAATEIDIDDIANLVATTGHAISKLEGNPKNKNYRERSIVEFGVLRYPQLDDPRFKLYCIKLFAWADCEGSLFKKSNNGIKGVFLKRMYRPNEEIIEMMKKEAFDRAVAAAEDLIMLDD